MALCAASLLVAPLMLAQEPPAMLQPLPPRVQQPQAPENTAPTALTTVHGVVRNAATGEPLPRALVRIEGDADTGALTDGEGRFELAGVPVGPQIFEIEKPGFYDPAATGVWAGKPPESVAHNALLAAEMPDLDFVLVPAGAIRGKLELSTGDPASGFWVSLLRRVVQDGRAEWANIRNVRTDGGGFYRFGGLPDGDYTVHAASQLESIPVTILVESGAGDEITRSGYPATYYPDAHQLASAGKIRLTSGEEAIANLYLTLEPFYTVTATILGAKGGTAAVENDIVSAQNTESPILMLLDSEDHFLLDRVKYDPVSHTAQAVLPNGSYAFAVRVPDKSHSVTEESGAGYKHPAYLAALTPFTVSGHAAKDLRIPLSWPHSYLLHLSAQTSGGTQSGTLPPSGLNSVVGVRLGNEGESLVEPDHGWNALKVGPDDFELMRSPLFTYWVRTRVYGKGLCAGSLRASGVNLTREPLELSLSGPSMPMELAVRNDCAQLNLSLPSPGAQPLGIEPVYTVYVVPDFDSTEEVDPHTIRPSSGGNLLAEDLTPGSYHVYTFTAPVELEYRNPAALARLAGQSVTLAPGERGSLVLEVPRQ